MTKTAKALPSKEQQKFQVYQLYLTSHLTLTDIGNKYGVCRQTAAKWIEDVRGLIDEPTIIEAAKHDLTNLVPEALRYYGRAMQRERVDMIGLVAATNTLKESGVITEKHRVEVELVRTKDEELEDEIARIITNRFKPFVANGQNQN